MGYKHMSVYPKSNEKEIWKGAAGEFGINFSNFARRAINSYLEIHRIFNPDTVPTPDTNFIDEELVKRIAELVKENERLKQINDLRAAMKNLTADYWGKVWEVIPTDRYKSVREILADAGIIDSSMDYIEIQTEIRHLHDLLRIENELAKLEGREPPLEYDPAKGWMKKELD